MTRLPGLLIALAVAAPALLSPPPAWSSDRVLPMRFELRKANPDTCGKACNAFVTASGAITADTVRDFELFAKGRNLNGMTIALDSDGGSVLGAIKLGRDIRKFGLNTTVGRAIDADAGDERAPYASLSARADCQSMCAFVLLAGVQRSVPAEARVMVHQIWLGDRRDDPTAANYSAEDLVLVQHDIGSLAQYTVEMGASIDMLDLSLRIPPWEPMHQLTASEISRFHVATDVSADPAPVTVPVSPPSAATTATPLIVPAAVAVAPTAISEQRWAVVDRGGINALARRHPLTIEGEDIGSFDLSVACAGPDTYDVSYAERRRATDDHPLPAALTNVTLTVAGKSAPLKVVSSQRANDPDELLTFASATIPSALIGKFAAVGNHSLMLTTRGSDVSTGIRLGNTGALQNLQRLATSCARTLGDRADLGKKTGGSVAAK